VPIPINPELIPIHAQQAQSLRVAQFTFVDIGKLL